MQGCSPGQQRNHSHPHSLIDSGLRMLLLLMMISGVTGAETGGTNKTCAMRGICAESKIGPSGMQVRIGIPCEGPFEPLPVNSRLIRERLAEFCPNLDVGGNLCCDDENAVDLIKNFETAQTVFGGCPVCFRNFLDMWCQYTCSPLQSQFVIPVKNETNRVPVIEEVTSPLTYTSGSPLVTEVDFLLDPVYIHSVIESCVKVQFVGSPVLGLACEMPTSCIQKEMSTPCLEACLVRLGTPRLKAALGVRINFKYDGNEIRHLITSQHAKTGIIRPLTSEFPLQRCEESSAGCAACSCSDCFGACSATPPFLENFEKKWAKRKGAKIEDTTKSQLSGMNHSGVEVAKQSQPQFDFSWFMQDGLFGLPRLFIILYCLCFIAAIVSLFFCFMCDSKKKRGVALSSKKIKFAGTYWGARDLLDNAQRGGAEWYAKVVAHHFLLIGACTFFLVAVVCVFGLPRQKFVLDPVDVWTQKDSRSRIEKDTFEKYFKAIPRYTQVIIRPMHTYKKSFHYGKHSYGPIFQPFVMQQAFELTTQLIELRGKGIDPSTGKERELGLSDVCYKMIEGHCFVMSPMSYLQNNKSIVDCANRLCNPEVEREMNKEIHVKKKGEEKEKEVRALGKKKMAFFDQSKFLLEKLSNGTAALSPIEMDAKEKEQNDDEDIFDDFSMKKRRKREVSPHTDHRARTKRHISIKNVDMQQSADMARGIGLLPHLQKCIEIPIASSEYMNLECGSQMGRAPIPGNLVFGGWNEAASSDLIESTRILHYSNAYVITIALDSKKKELAEIWEKAVIDLLKKYSNELVEVNFITQLSIQDEINAAARSDVRIVGLGYALMAFYIIWGLSQFSIDNRKGILRHTFWHQIFPGFMVSVTITLSVLFVIAFYGIIGLHATLMCMEVQPFLLCAIGVNNIFYFVKTYQREVYKRKQQEAARLSPISAPPHIDSTFPSKEREMSDDESERGSLSDTEKVDMEIDQIEEIIRREVLTDTCQRVLPSMFCTAFTECVCFLSLGLSDAPVLKVFSFYASAGVLVNFFFTLMIFVPSFFIAMKFSSSPRGICSPVDCVPKKRKEMRRRTRRRFDQIRSSRGWMPYIIGNYYAPMIFTNRGRYSIVSLQFILIAIAIFFIPRLPIGLDEKMSVPVDSYVYKFMAALPDTLATSMPVHFVVHSKSGKELNVNDEKFARLFCTSFDCAKNSLGNLIDEAVKVTKTDLIAQPAMNWIDDYRKFRAVSSSGFRSCCLRDGGKDEYCQLEEVEKRGGVENSNCTACLNNGDSAFHHITRDLRHFTLVLPTIDCGTSGGMAHREAISFSEKGGVNAFYLRSFHRTFRNSSDYIDGLRLSRAISDEFKKVLDQNGYSDVEIFPYSYYYVFYDQYLYIAFSTSSQLALSAGIAFIGLTLTTVSPTTALIVAVNTLSSTLLLIGYMVMRDIELNALTIVNLAMSLGIDLEFFAHLCFAYANSGRVDRIGRATDALVNVGSTVVSGIIFTKFLGLIVLYNAQSQIFKTYYFDFYLGLLPIGTIHGLVFLPVMLTFWGPDTYLRRYMEQNDKSSLTNGEGQTSDEGRPESTSSPRSLILLPSASSSKTTSSRAPPTYGRVAAAISPAATHLTTNSIESNGSVGDCLPRQSSSPSLLPSMAASTIDHESAPLVARVESARSNQRRELA